MTNKEMGDFDEDFVYLGTPFSSDDEESVFKTKKSKVLPFNEPVKDAQGRVRFHGAFTGGFSAGYYNTVGSKEGWKPSTFRSARGQKNEGREGGQKPEDFMDEDDLGEFGIAPKQLLAKQDFNISGSSMTSSTPKFGGVIPGDVPADLIAPAPDPIGVRLLQQMGWRSGQGVGPRLNQSQLRRHKRKIKKRKKENNIPGGSISESGSESDEDDDVTAANQTFAPRYEQTVEYKGKNDLFGIGYSPLANPNSLFTATNDVPSQGRLLMGDAITGNKRQSSMKGFGIGALEDDDDDDVYGTDNISSYDWVLGASDQVVKKALQHSTLTAPSNQMVELCSDGRPVIGGFKLATKPTEIGKWYPAPSVPIGWRPYQWDDQKVPDTQITQSALRNNLTAEDRKIMLEEHHPSQSVFSFIKQADKAKIEQIATLSKQTHGSLHTTSTSKPSFKPGLNFQAVKGIPLDNTKPRTSDDWVTLALEKVLAEEKAKAQLLQQAPLITTNRSNSPPGMLNDEGVNNMAGRGKVQHITPSVASAALQSTLNPFSNNPAKHARYQEFLKVQASLGSTVIDPPKTEKVVGFFVDKQGGPGLTEWETQQELEEFIKAAQMFRPMNSVMASRFVSAVARDDDTSAKIPQSNNVIDDPKIQAVKNKMFGPLTHTVTSFHPVHLLCKRMGVPDLQPIKAQGDTGNIGTKSVPSIKKPVAALQFKPANKEEESPHSDTPLAIDEVEDIPKAPMDLFKAIFTNDNSSSSSSESDDDTNESINKKPSPIILDSNLISPSIKAPLPAYLSSEPAPIIVQPQAKPQATSEIRGGHSGVSIFAANKNDQMPLEIGVDKVTDKRVHQDEDELLVGPLYDVPKPPQAEVKIESPKFMLGPLKGLNERGIVIGPPRPPISKVSAQQSIKTVQQSNDDWTSNEEEGEEVITREKGRKRHRRERSDREDRKRYKEKEKENDRDRDRDRDRGRKKDKEREKEKDRHQSKRKAKVLDESGSSDDDNVKERGKRIRREEKDIKRKIEGKKKHRKGHKERAGDRDRDRDGESDDSTQKILRKIKHLGKKHQLTILKDMGR